MQNYLVQSMNELRLELDQSIDNRELDLVRDKWFANEYILKKQKNCILYYLQVFYVRCR